MLYYKNEEELVSEATRCIGAAKTNIHTNPLVHALNAIPFIELKKDMDADNSEDAKGFKTLARDMRRDVLVKNINILFKQGFKAARIAAILNAPYSTVLYHYNKIKWNIKTRKPPTYLYSLNENKKIKADLVKRSEGEKLLILRAREKRRRKMEKIANRNK